MLHLKNDGDLPLCVVVGPAEVQDDTFGISGYWRATTVNNYDAIK